MAPEVQHDYGDPQGFLASADDVLQRCLDTFGVEAFYQAFGAEPAQIPNGGIFRETHREIEEQTGMVVTSQQPTLDVRRTEVPAEVGDNDRVLVGPEGARRTFLVEDVQKDGEVGAKIFLNEVTP